MDHRPRTIISYFAERRWLRKNRVHFSPIYSIMNAITSFQGEYRFLSNFWPCYIFWEGLLYPTLEHAYAASKTDDETIKKSMRDCPTPGDAKEYLAANGLQIIPGWTEVKKLQVMEDLLFIKFGGKEPLLTRALLHTGNAELVEGNTWGDSFWGVCNGAGNNNLGKLLMKVRGQLRQEKEQLEQLAVTTADHALLAQKMGLSRLHLYEKMMAFGISQKEHLGY